MAWQDELNSLDEELSSGRIRADEYRRRRDELLAAASSNPVSLRRIHRQQPPSIANAFNGDSGEVTQQVDLSKAQWETKPPEHRQQQAPRPVMANPAPPMQADEVFGLAANATAPNRQKWPRFVAAIAVLAVLAAGIWWFALRDNTAPETVANQPVQGQLSLDRVPNPTDAPMTYSGVFTVDQAQVYNLLKPDEAATLVQAGSKRILFRGASSGNLVFHTFAYETTTTDVARELATSAMDRNKRVGMVDATGTGVPQGIQVVKSLGDKSAVIEAIYPTEQATIRVLVVQTGPNDERQLSDAIRRGVDAAVKAFPIG
jgi:hypothetical protein